MPAAARSSEVFAPNLLLGHVAIVTGGGTNLGRAAAAELIACGAEVVIAGRRSDVLEQTSGDLGPRCSWVSGDIRVAADCERIVDVALERHGRVHTLLNNAGPRARRRARERFAASTSRRPRRSRRRAGRP